MTTRKIILVVVILLLFVGAGYAGYTYYKKKNPSQ